MRRKFQFECSGKRPDPGLVKPTVVREGSPRSFRLTASKAHAALGSRLVSETDRRWSDAPAGIHAPCSRIIQTQFPGMTTTPKDEPSPSMVWLQADPSRYCSPPLPPALHLDRSAFRHFKALRKVRLEMFTLKNHHLKIN
jgi:hypothetical protein